MHALERRALTKRGKSKPQPVDDEHQVAAHRDHAQRNFALRAKAVSAKIDAAQPMTSQVFMMSS